MTDFSLKAAHEFWRSYSDPMVYRAVLFMESTESWTLDGDPALEAAIENLGRAMDDIADLSIDEQERFVQLLSSIKITRTLFIMQTMDNANPGSASKLLAYAEERTAEEASKLFIQRNIIFERLRLLGRVFSEDRLNQLQAVLDHG